MVGNGGRYFGGVVSFNREDFEKINGFPNTFWGWGGEDDEMYSRIMEVRAGAKRKFVFKIQTEFQVFLYDLGDGSIVFAVSALARNMGLQQRCSISSGIKDYCACVPSSQAFFFNVKMGCIIHLFLIMHEVVPERILKFTRGLVHSLCMVDRSTWCHRKRRKENSQI